MKNSIELRKKRAVIWAAMEALNGLAAKEDRAFKEDEQAKWSKMDEEMRSLKSQIEVQERNEALATEMADRESEESRAKGDKKTQPQDEYRAAFSAYMCRGRDGLTPEQRSLIERRGTETQVTNVDDLGGYLVPEMWSNNIITSLKHYAGIMEAADILPTSTGRILNVPTSDQTEVKGHRIAEGVKDVTKDMRFGRKQLGAYVYSSGIIKLSFELLQDNGYGLEGKLPVTIGERIGRILNEELTTGTGTDMPEGVLAASGVGPTSTAAAAVTRADLINLIHSINRAYRVGSKVRFMFNDTTLAAIKKLSIGSSDDRPLWSAGMVTGAPDRLEGFQYIINNDMPDLATGNKAILFGDFSKYTIRQVKTNTILRLNEKYADERVVGFYGFARYDGKLLDTKAIKHLQQA